MFEQLHKPIAFPRWAAVSGAVGGGFSLGMWVGKLLAGGRPFDWVLDVSDALFALALTIWCTFRAIKSSD